MTNTTLEDVYDEDIAPLMAEIIERCKVCKIHMVASFQLDHTEEHGPDDPLMCTTILLHGSDGGGPKVAPSLSAAADALAP